MLTLPETPGPARPGRLWALAIAASLVAAATAGLVGEALHLAFVPPVHMVQTMTGPMNLPTFESRSLASWKNATVASGVFGSLLGLMLGLAGGLARGSGRLTLSAGMAGLILGGAAGVASTAGLYPLYVRHLIEAGEELATNLVVPALIHAGIWSSIGLAAGAALGMGAGRGRVVSRAAFGGLAGGLLGSVLYEVLGALAFPTGGASEPVALTLAPRLISRFIISLMVAAVATFAILDAGKAAAPEPLPTPAEPPAE